MNILHIICLTTLMLTISLSYGTIIRQTHQLPSFGREMRQEFLMKSNYVLLNHGSLGTYPKATRNALREYQDRIEESPDFWLRHNQADLDSVRELIAKLIQASADDIVMIINTTTAINSILRSMTYAFGDRILQFSTIFSSMGSIIKYICDTSNGGVTALTFNLTYPISDDQVVTNLETFLQETHDPLHPIRIAVIDHITSIPGVIVPIDKIIPLLKAHNITVIVDAAHAIGQIPINITALAPDYYVTNCYKWLYTARGCAVLYVDKKHQQTLHPANINAAYSQPANLQNEFYWTGTIDYSSFMTVSAALKFRDDVGGEAAIMAYNRRLVIDGGNYLATVLDTEIIQELNQIANMIDVRLPINEPDDSRLSVQFFNDQLSEISVRVHKYERQWYIRVSAQIYNDLYDFEVLGNSLIRICNDINGNKSKAALFTAGSTTALVAYSAYSFLSLDV